MKRNKAKFQNDLLQNMKLRKKDGKMFWKLLDKLGQKQGNEILKINIHQTNGSLIFKMFLITTTLKSRCLKTSKKRGPIDYSISDEEIKLWGGGGGAYILRGEIHSE